jgi:transglutaminase-like putative cysteine protease
LEAGRRNVRIIRLLDHNSILFFSGRYATNFTRNKRSIINNVLQSKRVLRHALTGFRYRFSDTADKLSTRDKMSIAMILDASCQISYQADFPIPAIMMLRPRSGYAQWITREEYTFEPHTEVVEYTDRFGNLCQRVLIPKGGFEVRCSCRAHTADEIDVDAGAPFVSVHELPESALEFLLPSRYAQSDLLNELASSIVGKRPAGYPQVAAIEQWLRDEMKYVRGSSNARTSAVETAKAKAGVCRDYAHLGIALTRSLNIPARMVVGYLYELEPMDLHAWFEAFVGTQWFSFDGTQATPRGNRIAIGYGRDAADVALTSNYGTLELKAMKVTVEKAAESRASEPWTRR